jgi:hypothetical protein
MDLFDKPGLSAETNHFWGEIPSEVKGQNKSIRARRKKGFCEKLDWRFIEVSDGKTHVKL